MLRVIKSDITDIEVVVRNEQNMYQEFGHGSNMEKSINKEFENYIFSCVKNYSVDRNIRLVLYIGKQNKHIEDLEKCIHSHFCFKVKEMDLYLKQQFKQWVINVFIGILFLVLCLLLVQVLEVFSYINIIKIIKESLLIIGWVALWEPVTFILFNWRSMKRDRLYYKKLCIVPVIVFHSTTL